MKTEQEILERLETLNDAILLLTKLEVHIPETLKAFSISLEWVLERNKEQ